jgi:hypothetical protein
MACCAVARQGAGVAAAWSVKNGKEFTDVDLGDVQATLEKQAFGSRRPCRRGLLLSLPSAASEEHGALAAIHPLADTTQYADRLEGPVAIEGITPWRCR